MNGEEVKIWKRWQCLFQGTILGLFWRDCGKLQSKYYSRLALAWLRFKPATSQIHYSYTTEFGYG
jgi:hypothetical protein